MELRRAGRTKTHLVVNGLALTKTKDRRPEIRRYIIRRESLRCVRAGFELDEEGGRLPAAVAAA